MPGIKALIFVLNVVEKGKQFGNRNINVSDLSDAQALMQHPGLGRDFM